MDWSNVNLNSTEINAAILDEYTFAQLLLEIHCNVKEIDKASISNQFRESLQNRVDAAIEIFNDNLDRILEKSISYRND